MAIEDNLFKAIRNVFGSAVITTHTAASDAADLYELFVFCLVLEAAREEGATIEFRDVEGCVPTSLVFRTSPGDIASRRQPYTHAVVRFPSKPVLEAHVGIYVAGKSLVAHECDVAVVYQDEADTCRRNPGILPRHSKVVLAAECKFYTVNLKLALGRAFLGLVADIAYQYGERYFVMNTASDSVAKLLAKHKQKLAHDLVPSEPIEVTKLRASFQSVFDHFKMRE